MKQEENQRSNQEIINSVIVEDEKRSQEALYKMLKQCCPEVKVVSTAETVEDAVKIIDKLKPELIFLDIALPDGDGFNVLEQISLYNYQVVFVTAYDKYAIRAFEFSTLHYLLKPISHADLINTIEKYRRIRNENSSEYKAKISLLKDNFKGELQKIMLPTADGFEIISLDDIIRFEANHNYTFCYLKGERKILVSKSLINFENLLQDLHFIRVHSKHLVNLKYILKYIRGRGGSIKMIDNSEINVSKSRRNEFLAKLADFAHHL